VDISAPWLITGDFTAANNPAYFSAQVISGPSDVPAGTYLGWCVDTGNDIGHGPNTYSALFFASCDPNLNQELGTAYPPSVYVSPDVWHQVNYILNHKNGAYFWNIQLAIWMLVGGPIPPDELSGPPSFPPADLNQVNALVAAAQANAAVWQPQCGDITAIVVQIPNLAPVLQLLILEVPCHCPPSANCVTINAVQGVAITPVTMVGSGGCGGPYTFSAVGLPASLTMSSSGTISGTPTVSGSFTYTVTVKDNCGNAGTVNCSVTVNPPPTANCVTINAVQGVAITPVTMVASGGCGGPYTFSASLLPAVLTMSSSGTISGTPTVSGTFTYTVTIKDGCGNTGTISCSVTVKPPPGTPLVPGDTATIGFWHNRNGQALILSMNGGPNSTALGNWLASNFNCLFGNLSGAPNTVVAAQFLTYFTVSGQKTYAQVMGVALASYVTSSTLAGNNSMAGNYGFNVSPAGTGAKTYNVGPYGAAIGLVNNQSYTIMQLLIAANANCSGGVISAGAFNALNSIFDGINSKGDI